MGKSKIVPINKKELRHSAVSADEYDFKLALCAAATRERVKPPAEARLA